MTTFSAPRPTPSHPVPDGVADPCCRPQERLRPTPSPPSGGPGSVGTGSPGRRGTGSEGWARVGTGTGSRPLAIVHSELAPVRRVLRYQPPTIVILSDAKVSDDDGTA